MVRKDLMEKEDQLVHKEKLDPKDYKAQQEIRDLMVP